MEHRKLILHIQLWSLALAAAAGVIAVLSGNDEVIFRVMWTGLATAISAGLAFPLLMMLEKQTRRPAGLYGLSFVLFEFFLALVLIWVAENHLPRGYDEEEVAITMVSLIPGAFAAFGLLTFLNTSWNRAPMFIGLAACGGSCIAFVIATWHSGSYSVQSNWWGTGWVILGYGLLMALPIIKLNTDDRLWWRWAGVITAVVGALVLFTAIWEGSEFEKLVSLTTTGSIFITYLNLMLLFPLKDRQRWVRMATILCAAVLGVLINTLVLTQSYNEYGSLARLVAAAGIVTACGTMALLILAALNKRMEASQQTMDMIEMTIVCPRCNTKQQIKTGESACSACDLKINIRIEEPRCPECDYLLYRLTSDRCPECGTVIIKGSDES